MSLFFSLNYTFCVFRLSVGAVKPASPVSADGLVLVKEQRNGSAGGNVQNPPRRHQLRTVVRWRQGQNLQMVLFIRVSRNVGNLLRNAFFFPAACGKCEMKIAAVPSRADMPSPAPAFRFPHRELFKTAA